MYEISSGSNRFFVTAVSYFSLLQSPLKVILSFVSNITRLSNHSFEAALHSCGQPFTWGVGIAFFHRNRRTFKPRSTRSKYSLTLRTIVRLLTLGYFLRKKEHPQILYYVVVVCIIIMLYNYYAVVVCILDAYYIHIIPYYIHIISIWYPYFWSLLVTFWHGIITCLLY